MKQILLILMLAFASMVHAQTYSAEVLTNAKIVSMSKGGLPKAVILASIQNKPGNFDVSTDALIALKKQGVADDVITAMIGKGAKPEPAPVVKENDNYPAVIKPDSKDCNFVQEKAPAGQSYSMIKTSAKLGNFLVGKDGNKIILSYGTKMGLSIIVDNGRALTSLKIDSVQFLFTDNTVVTLKAVNSIGTLPNSNDQLRPQMTNVHFVTFLESGSKADASFTHVKLKLFKLIGEREMQYGDVFNDKQQDKLLQAFGCIQ